MLAVERLGIRLAGKQLLSDVSWQVESGGRLVVTGPSGAGKSVMLRSLVGLVPMSAGVVSLDGQPLTALAPPIARARVTYVPQTPPRLPGTMADNLKIVRGLDAVTDSLMPWDAVMALCERLSIAALLEQNADKLSGGEAQRMGLVRALQINPRVLLLDEPTSALDASAAQRAEELLTEWAAEDERAFVWVAHDQALAERLGSSVLRVADGTAAYG